MVRKSAWFLNFDADEELARPLGYSSARAVLSRSAALAGRVGPLLGPEDIVVGEGQSLHVGRGVIGRAWCPTPRAQKALRAAGATVAAAPALDVLRAVNHRRFNADLGQTLPGRFALTLEEVTSTLGGRSPTGQWLLKRPFGFAGRGRLQVAARSAADMRHAMPWIEASLRTGEGLQVEWLVQRLGDFALHGYLRRDGTSVLGEPTTQQCDDTGAWVGSARAETGDLAAGESAALSQEAQRAAAALHNAGYWGPFGIDAFRFKGVDGAPYFNARGEINARYSMGWAVGMGDRRPDLEDLGVP